MKLYNQKHNLPYAPKLFPVTHYLFKDLSDECSYRMSVDTLKWVKLIRTPFAFHFTMSKYNVSLCIVNEQPSLSLRCNPSVDSRG